MGATELRKTTTVKDFVSQLNLSLIELRGVKITDAGMYHDLIASLLTPALNRFDFRYTAWTIKEEGDFEKRITCYRDLFFCNKNLIEDKRSRNGWIGVVKNIEFFSSLTSHEDESIEQYMKRVERHHLKQQISQLEISIENSIESIKNDQKSIGQLYDKILFL